MFFGIRLIASMFDRSGNRRSAQMNAEVFQDRRSTLAIGSIKNTNLQSQIEYFQIILDRLLSGPNPRSGFGDRHERIADGGDLPGRGF